MKALITSRGLLQCCREASCVEFCFPQRDRLQGIILLQRVTLIGHEVVADMISPSEMRSHWSRVTPNPVTTDKKLYKTMAVQKQTQKPHEDQDMRNRAGAEQGAPGASRAGRGKGVAPTLGGKGLKTLLTP